MNALIVDALPPETRAGLEALGLQVTEDTSLGSHNLAGAVADVEILIVGRTRVTRRTIEAAERLELIVHAGSGVETIDVAAASERGVFVSHCAAADAAARAELVIGMALALDRRLAHPVGAREGDGAGLRGRSLGICGWDATATDLRGAAAGLGMRVLAFDPTLTTARASELGVHPVDSVDALFARCEVISLHAASSGDDVIATAPRIAAMPAGATLINVSRRGLVDLAAAAERLTAGTLALGLDVYDADDYGDDVPFAADAFPTLLATPKIAARTDEARDAIASTVVGHVEAFVFSSRVPDSVNVAALRDDDQTTSLIVRHKPSRTVLASVFEALRDAEVEVLSVETGRFSDDAAAYIQLVVDRPPTAAVETAIQRNPDVIRLDSRA